jgi:polysaccharide export outer membrane protein
LASTTFYAIIVICFLRDLRCPAPFAGIEKANLLNFAVLTRRAPLKRQAETVNLPVGSVTATLLFQSSSHPSGFLRLNEVQKMKPKILWVSSVLLCLIVVVLVPAQEPAQTQTGAGQQSSSVDTQGIRNYLLGPGDVLDVRVFGQSDLNSVVEVDSDGNLSALPFLETPIRAKCRTEKAVQKDIAAAYGKYIKNPQVSVRISERKSRQPATVFGAVRQAARVQMLRSARLNELMAASGGFTERAAGTIQILHTEPLMCPEPGEEAEAAPIDGTKLPLKIVKISDLKAGKLEANPIIRPGDYILVTEAEPVYVTGSVASPQGIFMRDQLTLSLAVAMVGGPKDTAKTSDVRIYRQKPGSQEQETIRVDLAAIKKNQKPDVLLQPYDVIDVPDSSPFSAKRIIPTLFGGMQSLITNAPLRVLY